MRIIKIENCFMCPYVSPSIINGHCKKPGGTRFRVIKDTSGPIPNWCPLEKAKE